VSRAVASRYQPVLVALHWLLAVMIIGLLCVGFFVLADMPNTDPKKLQILILHMSGGMIVLVLMIVRLIINLRSARPPKIPTGSSVLDRLAPVMHYGLYAVVFLMAASGWATGWFIRNVFQPNGGLLPSDFDALPTFQVHSILATLLVILIAGHIVAGLYHQFVLKDGIFRRIWFGKRTITPTDK
jgi:cytochrome b561